MKRLPPGATYRLQFNANFTFADAVAIAPYLASLGVTHVYASPIQKARPSSTHGYDIVDHSTINPELGGEAGFCEFTKALSLNGLKLLLDIVPNHMGVGGADNAWWLSVLEWGEQSPFVSFFDIDWERIGTNGKLVLPFLGKPYGAALREGELQLRFDNDQGAFSVWHWEHKFPVNPLDYRFILEWAQVAGGGGLAMRPLYQMASELRELAEAPRPVTQEGRVTRCERIKRDLSAHFNASQPIRDAVDKAVAFACGDPRTPESFSALHELLQRQAYRIAHWRVASSETNYRRFFDINSLAGVRVEEGAVFEATHKLIFSLIEDDLVHGLRIDHIDGLADPQMYLELLRARLGPDFYIVVEKILEPGEALPSWPIAGATGYEAMVYLDGIFASSQHERRFTEIYEKIAGYQQEFEIQLRDAKLELLRISFRSELETLVSDVQRAAQSDLLTSDFTLDEIRRAIAEIIAHLPVYRTYIDQNPVRSSDRMLVTQAVAHAKRMTSLDTSAAHDLVQSYLVALPDADRSPYLQTLIERIIRRFQQITGPVMAKSLEDTLFYRFARFVALNDVGGDPQRFGVDVDAFHAFNVERALRFPHALTATATHDTKRGEDVRARLFALSHRPDVWVSLVEAAHETSADTPDPIDRYMLLQTIVGAWPMAADKSAPLEPDDLFRQRLLDYATKSVRESKRHSSWTAPDQAYEDALHSWIDTLLASARFKRALWTELPPIAQAGSQISLSRLVLKMTVPGVPDIYQGCELEDLSLVDPDNRRAVDYGARASALENGTFDPNDLKLSITATLLRDRASTPELYASGNYQPLSPSQHDLVCFSRAYGSDQLVVATSINPFECVDVDRIVEYLAIGDGWSNLLEGHALNQRKHGGPGLPAVVLRKSS
ncbi:MAG: malto-oligosyltrehalose synthase [Beijerinckiaceae bacterium]|nr:malto-oligosyltrehalose synthase [Beijerinckiaceae bacterium]